MKHLNKIITIALITIISIAKASAINLGLADFNNEKTDTTTITQILIDAAQKNLTTGERIAYIGQQFLNKPYKAGLLEGKNELLRVNIDQFDCTTFVETVLALTKTIAEHRTSWQDFLHNLEQIRYRNGNLNGYGSRLHYVADWIVDNSHRGNLKDVTDRIAQASYAVKTIDFMSANRSKYPALSDQNNFDAIKNAEIGYRNHKIPYIKSTNINKANLKTGDIVGITTTIKNLDVTHMGIIVMKNNTPHLLHASSAAGKIILDPLPLADYLHRNKNATGIRVIRLVD